MKKINKWSGKYYLGGNRWIYALKITLNSPRINGIVANGKELWIKYEYPLHSPKWWSLLDFIL